LLLLIVCKDENDGVWGHRVVGNGKEGVLGLRHDNIARFDRQGFGKALLTWFRKQTSRSFS